MTDGQIPLPEHSINEGSHWCTKVTILLLRNPNLILVLFLVSPFYVTRRISADSDIHLGGVTLGCPSEKN